MRRTPQNELKKLVPLRQLAKASSYSFGYISILVQRKKLKAKKIGNKYYSTQEWFNQYLDLHAQDAKKPKTNLGTAPAGDLKNQVNDLVAKAIIEKLEAKATPPEEFVKWENLNAAPLFGYSAEQEGAEEFLTEPLAANQSATSEGQEKSQAVLSSAAAEERKNLPEILDSKIKDSFTDALLSGEIKFMADLEAPENKLAGVWKNNFHEEEKKLKSAVKSAAKKTRAADRGINSSEFFIAGFNQSIVLKIKKLLSLTLKLSAAGAFIFLAAFASAQVAPQIFKSDLARSFKNSLANSAETVKSNLTRVFQFNSAREFQHGLARTAESRSIKAVAGVKIIAGQSSSSGQFAMTQAKHIADSILPVEYLDPLKRLKNKALAFIGWPNPSSQDSSGQVAGEIEIAAAILTPSTLPSVQNNADAPATSLASAQVTPAVSTTARQMEILALITDKQGKISDGEYDIRFALYNKNRTAADAYPSNADQNNKIWEETQKVTIKNGALRAILGWTKDLPLLTLAAADQFYLGIRIANDSEMTPRKKMPAPFYAFNAMNASQLNGKVVGNKAGNIPALNTAGKNIGRLDYSLMPTEVTDFLSAATGGAINQPGGATTTLSSSLVNINFGGTGLAAYAKGDMLYYDSGKTMTRLAIGQEGQVLSIVNGLPVWSNSKSSTVVLGGGGGSSIRSTSDLPEGTNLYWTDARFDAKFTTSIATAGTWTSSGSNIYRPTGNVGIGTSSPSAKLTVWGAGEGSNQLVNFVNSASTTLLTILENGKVGIGTSSPTDVFSVNGPIYLADVSPTETKNRLYADGSNLYWAGSLIGGATAGNWTTDGTNAWRMAGNVGLGTSSPSAKFSINAGLNSVGLYLAGYANNTSDMFRISTSTASATSTVFVVDSNGKVGIGAAAPRTALELGGDGAILSTGTLGAGWIEPDLGAGTRMIWYPRQAAFRAGNVDGAQWNNSNIGQYSSAFGLNTIASGANSFAMGDASIASGYAATAMGYLTKASGDGSVALGSSATSSGSSAVSLGNSVKATGDSSVAMGDGSLASGFVSIAIGNSATASGEGAVAMGAGTIASGVYSVALGNTTTADSYNSFALGRYNVGGGTAGSWVATDPLFEIGNGTSASAKANALTILKNGLVAIGTTTPSAKLNVYGGNVVFQTPSNSLTAFQILNAATTSVFSVATTGFGTTTLAGLNISGSATSTSNVGYDITAGCFAINGVCLKSGTATALDDLTDVAITAAAYGDLLMYNGSAWADTGTTSLGLVTSIAMTVPTGLTVSGSPITTNGTFALSFTGGYSIPLSASTTEGSTAYTRSVSAWTSPLQFSAGTASILQANASQSGYLSNTDWSSFNSKISSSSLSAVWPLAYNSSTGQITSATSSASSAGVLSSADWNSFNNKWDLSSTTIGVAYGGTGLTGVGASSTVMTTNGTIMKWNQLAGSQLINDLGWTSNAGTVTGVTGAYPIVSTGGAAPVISLAFGTTTPNTWSLLQQFTNASTTQLTIANQLYDKNNDAGALGQILSSTVTGADWISTSSLKINTDDLVQGSTNLFNYTHTGEVTGATSLTVADNVIDEANLKISTSPTNNFVLIASSSAAGGLDWVATSSSLLGLGTVTSIAMTVPEGLTVSGSPITTNGTFALSFTGGYSIPLSASTTEGSTAYTRSVSAWTSPLQFSAGTASILQANASQSGYLSNTDWSSFNSKISSSSISAVWPLSYNSSTGQITSATSSASSAGVLSSADWNSFNNKWDLSSTTIGVAYGGTNATSQTTNGVNYYNGTSITSGAGLTFDGTKLGIGTTSPYSLLSISNSATTAINTPLFTIASTTAGNSTSTLMTVLANGNVGIGTANPGALLQVNGNALFGTVSPSTAVANPINVSFGGTYGNQIPGTKSNLKWTMYDDAVASFKYGIGMSLDLMEFQAGTNGGFGFYPNGGTVSALAINSTGLVAIGTTTPSAKLNVYGGNVVFQTPSNSLTAFQILNAATTSVFSVATTGFGTTTLAGLNISGSATSTSNVGYDITAGCFAINGVCLKSGTATALDDLTDVAITAAAYGDLLMYNGSAWADTGTTSLGLVTSIAMTVPTGLTVSGSPITTNGTFALSFTGGYSIPLSASTTEGSTAYTRSVSAWTSPLQFSAGTASILQANASQSGYLSNTDWSSFNSKISSSSLSAVWPLAYNSSTGQITSATSSASSAGVLSSADWNLFNNKWDLSSTTIGVAYGGTGKTTFTSGQLIYGNGTNALSSAATTTLTASGALTLSNPIYVIGGSASVLTISDAAANGSTKGAAAFTANDFSDNGSGLISLDYANGQTATALANGFLSSTDWSSFNSKISSSSLSAVWPLAYNSSTGQITSATSSASSAGVLSSADWNSFNNKWDLSSTTIGVAYGGTGLTGVGASSTVMTTNGTIMKWNQLAGSQLINDLGWTSNAGTVTGVTGAYPIVSTGGAAPVISLAFGTTTPNTWSLLQQFTNASTTQLTIANQLYDKNNDAGALGQILSSTVTGADWISTSSLKINTDDLVQGSTNLFNYTHTGEVTGATSLTVADNVIDEANLKISTSPTNNFVLIASSSAAGGLDWVATSSSLLGLGTVTSIAMTVPEGLTVSGSPITTNGTFALSFTGGYSIPLSASTTEGSTAYTRSVSAWTSPLQFSAGTASILQSNASQSGYLSNTDWSSFNSKISSSSLSAVWPLAYNSSTGQITSATSSASSAGVLSSADWNLFNNKWDLSSTTIGVAYGGTGKTTFTSGQLIYGNGTNALSSAATTTLTASGALTLSNPIYVIGGSASVLTISDAAANGSTKGAAAFTANDFSDNGSGLISLDYANGQTATALANGFLSSTDWSSFNSKISSSSLSAVWPLAYNSSTGQITSATSSATSAGVLSSADWNSFNNKWDLSSTTIGVAYGGTGLTSATAGYVLIGNSATALQATSSLYVSALGNVGIGTSTPSNTLVVSKTTTNYLSNGFEGGALQTPPFTTNGDANWAVQSTTKNSGTYAAKAGTISNNASSTLSLSITLTDPATVSFYYKVSSEQYYDSLFFKVNNTVKQIFSGEVDWTKYQMYLPAGSHTLTWIYAKDAATADGSDTAWVDDILIDYQTTSSLFAGQAGIGSLISGVALNVDGDINTSGVYKINNQPVISLFESNSFIGQGIPTNFSGVGNAVLGSNTGHALTTGSFNSFFGSSAGMANTTGYSNSAFGDEAFRANLTGFGNTAIGMYSLNANTSGSTNTSIGGYSLSNNTGSGNVAVGYTAGVYETGSNAFYLDNQDRTDLAGGKTKSLLYGTFAAAAANQNLTVNAHLNVTGTSTFTGLATFNGNASTTQITSTGSAYFATTGGNVGIGTTTPGTLLSLGNTGANTINISTTATSTFGTGLDIRTGCFAINGVCLSGGTGGFGTVTSIAMTVPEGLTVSGSPITTNGTFALSFTGGYSIPLSASTTEGSTAYTRSVSAWTSPLQFSAGTASILQSNASQSGYLSNTDWSSFNSKISSSSLSAVWPLAYNSSTGQITSATSSASSAGVLSSADWNLFNNKWDLSSTTIGVAYGGTNATAQTTNGVNYYNGTSITSGTGLTFTGTNLGVGTTSPYARLSVEHLSTTGTVIGADALTGFTGNLLDLKVASSSKFTINYLGNITTGGTFAPGGVGTNMIITSDASGILVSSSTPTAAAYFATSTTATSTFAGGFAAGGTSGLTVLQNGKVGIGTTSPFAKLSIKGPDATGTSLAPGSIGLAAYGGDGILGGVGGGMYLVAGNGGTAFGLGAAGIGGGINITAGNGGSGSVLGTPSAGGSITINPGLGGDGIAASGNILLTTLGGNVAIGTTTPSAKLNVYGGDVVFQTPSNSLTAFQILNAATTSVFSVATTGFGTTTLAGLNISGSATSTSNVGYDITAGCFAINGVCLKSGTATALDDLTDVAITSAAYGDLLMYNGSAWADTGTTSLGLVTSIAMTVPEGLTVSGSPITTNGTFALSFTGGYSIPLSASTTEGSTAYTRSVSAWTSPLQFSAGTASILQSNASQSGYLSNTDWSSFNSKISSSSLSAVWPLAYNSSTGQITSATSSASSAGVLSSADWNLFNNKWDLSSTTIGVAYGGTNATAQTTNGVNYYNGTSITSGTGLTFTGTNLGVGTTSPYSLLSISNSATTAANTPLFTIASTTAGNSTSTLMTVLASGNVGIGTSSPGAKLDVNLNPALTYTTEKATFGPATTIANFGSGYSGIWLGGTVVQSAPSATNFTLISDGTGPIFNATTGGNLNLSIGNSVKLKILSTGNVGIGTTSPYARLSVEHLSTTGTVIGTDALTGFTGNLLDLKVASSSKFTINYLGNITTAGTFAPAGVGTNMLITSNASGVLVSSSTPTAAAYFATSTTATSTFAGGLIAGGTSGLTVLQNGKVGIGTVAPGSNLSIEGSFNTGNTTSALGSYSAAFGRQSAASGSGSFAGGGHYVSAGNNSVGATVSGWSAFGWGNVSLSGGNSVAFNLDPTTSATVSAANIMAILGGNLGIGTTSPYARLSVELLSTTGTVIGTDALTGFTGNLLDLKVASSSKFTINYLGNITTAGTFAPGGVGTNMIITSDASGILVSSSTPTAAAYFATSTTATSSFAGVFSIGSTTPSGSSMFSVGTSSPLLTVNRNNGFVGIGTAAPSAKFVIKDGSSASTLAFDTSNASYSLIQEYANNSLYLRGYSLAMQTNGANTRLSIDSTGNASFNSGQLYVQQSSGNIGIGTTSPAQKMHIYGTSAGLELDSSNTDDTSKLGFYESNVLKSFIQWRQTANATMPNMMDIGTMNTGGQIRLITGNLTEAVRIDSSGNVGIGTTSPYAKLSISANASDTYNPTLFAIASSTEGTATTTAFTVLANGNVGIGTTTLLNTKLTIVSNAAAESAVLGAELADGTGWTSTDWTGDYATGFTHTTGNTSPLSRSFGVTGTNKYQVTFTITGKTAGTEFTVSLGNSATYNMYIGDPATENQSAGITSVSDGDLVFTPDSDFDGTISNISVKQITGTYKPTIRLTDSSGAANLEIRSTTAGLANQFIGANAGLYNTTGYQNTIDGNNSFYYNTTGFWNSVLGASALINNTTGSRNSAVGYSALSANISGLRNAAVGTFALTRNTTGNQNQALGSDTLFYNTTGSNNIAIGFTSLYTNVSGSNNIGLGESALNQSTTASNNIGIGYRAGINLVSGSNNIIIGNNATATSSTSVNGLNIGNTIYGNTGTGYVGIGNTAPLTFLDIASTDTTGTGYQRLMKLTPYNVGTDGNGSYIQFSASAADGYGPTIGGIRTGSGLSDFLIKTGNYSAPIERMRITDAGLIGIATSTPVTQLQIGTNSHFYSPTGQDTALSNNIYYNAGWKYTTTNEGSMIYSDSNGNTDFYTTPSGTSGSAATITSRLRILNTGNVGIGTTSPYARLSVEHLSTTGTVIGTDALTGFTGNLLDLKVASSSKFTINYLGNITTAGTFAPGGVGTNMLITSDTSGILISSSTPTAAAYNATSTTATSTFAGNISTAKLAVTGLTSGRIPFVTGGSLLRDSANLSFDSTNNILTTNSVQANLLAYSGDWTFTGAINSANIIFKTNQTALASGAAESVRITGAGNFGIGTTSPSAKLAINQASTGLGFYLAGYAANTSDLFRISTSTASATSTAFLINSNGLVGIGTSTPSTQLSIAGNGLFSGTLSVGSLAGETSCLQAGPDGLITRTGSACGGAAAASGSLGWATSTDATNLESIYFTGLSNIGIGTTSPYSLLSISNSASTPINTPLFTIASTTAGNSTTTLMTVLASGNVGIGTTTPQYPLTIYSATGPQLSLSNGSGVAQWAIRNTGGNLYFATTTLDGTATSSPAKFTILANGNVGIGVSSPDVALDIYGSMRFGTAAVLTNRSTISSNGAGTLLLNSTNAGGVSVYGALTPASNGYDLGDATLRWDAFLKDVNTTGSLGVGTSTPAAKLSINAGLNSVGLYLAGYAANTSDMFRISTSTATATSTAFVIDANGKVGIGSSTPYAQLSVAGGIVGNYFTADSATATSSLLGGLDVGNGGLTYDYYSGVTSANALQTGNLNFDLNAGAVSWVDLLIDTDAPANTPQSYTANLNSLEMLTIGGQSDGLGNVKNLGVGIGSSTPYGSFTISPFSNSYPAFNIATSTGTTIGTYFVVDGNGKVGIGTSTPYANLSVVSAVTTDADVLVVSTSTSGATFRVTGYGNVWADGTITGAGADYAEYFRTNSTDLESGEIVCVDLLENNAVKRCERGHDNNVMGIVSTKPSIVGNNSKEVKDGSAGYAIVGMLGQVDAFVSAENGAIAVGDSLTSASSTPGYAMRAAGGDSTVGVALEPLKSGAGKIKVLISRRNKSLAVEEVEALVVERIAGMKIEDQVQAMIKQSVDNLNLDPKIEKIAQEEAGKLDARLTVDIDGLNGEITNLRTQVLASISDLNSGISTLSLAVSRIGDSMASTTVLAENIKIDEEGNLVIGGTDSATSTPEVRIIDPTEITASSTKAAFVVNQTGSGEVADFRKNGVSVMNIADSGQVKIMGSMLVDGRIMLCTGGNCSNALDSAVDETMADLGVEGKVVAGAFEGYCDAGFVWVPGSAKYGTLPGFCVMSDLMKTSPDGEGAAELWTNVSQGSAQAACQTLGTGYHLIGENEWLTIAENILQTAANDADSAAAGMQLSASTTLGKFVLTNDNVINNLTGAAAEWTNQNVLATGLPLTPESESWTEYSEVADYNGLNIAPAYYLTDRNNQIGKIYVGAGAGLRGFVRGFSGIYGLDLSHAPSEQSADIGFRCAK